MEVKAVLKHIRVAPKKSRLVIDAIRGMDAAEAASQLRFMRKKVARNVLKLLESAIANARNNFELKEDTLYIKKAFVDGGPVLKRWTPRAFGRASAIRKRTSHITIVLDEKGAKENGKKKGPAAAEKGKAGKSAEKKSSPVRPEVEQAKILKEAPKKEPKKIASAGSGEKTPPKDDKKGGIFDATRQGKHRSKQHQDKSKMKSA